MKSQIPISPAILMTINSDAAYRYIDTVHKTRGLNDIWRFMGHDSGVPSTVSAAIIFEHCDFKSRSDGGFRGMTKPEKYEIVRDAKFLQEAIELYKVSDYRNRVPCGPLAGAIRCMRKNRNKAMSFFTAAFTNTHMVEGEYSNPAKLLATWMLGCRMEPGKSAGEPFKQEGAEKAIRAWNAYRQGRPIRKLIRGDGIPKPV
jgi:hypothetical protein